MVMHQQQLLVYEIIFRLRFYGNKISSLEPFAKCLKDT